MTNDRVERALKIIRINLSNWEKSTNEIYLKNK